MPTPAAVPGSPDAGKEAGARCPGSADARGDCAVVVVDAEGIVRHVSANFDVICGYSRSEILGKSVGDLGSGRRDGAFFAAFRDALRGGKVWSGTFPAVRGDGSPRTESATVSPLLDASGAVTHCVGLRRDATDQGVREESIRKARAMEAVARLAGGMAHNFNNLLTSIIGYSDLLIPLVAGDPKAERSVEEIREAGERAAALTRQLLAFSREQALIPRTFNLNALVGALASEFRSCGTEGIEIRTALAGDLGTVTVDPDQIEQAVVTLAANARDAMPSGGRLTFATGNVRLDAPLVRQDVHVPPGRYVVLSISDTGKGMDAAIRDRIFEPFLTANEPGLAMAAVYGTVKQSGGYIWAFSRPGRGTTFEIYLPRTDRPYEAAGAVRGPAPSPAGANRLPGGGSHVHRAISDHALSELVRKQEGS